MQIHVADTYALLEVPRACSSPSELPPVLDGLTTMIMDGSLTFPDIVVQECRKYAQGDHIYTWINAVSGHRFQKAVPGQWHVEVLGICADIIDEDDEADQAPLFVASMARMLSASGSSEVYVVTEDRKNVPERKCLAEACKDLDLVTITVADLIARAPRST